MSIIDTKYSAKCSEVSDINEHLPTLYKYGKECNHITELGVRSVVSSYAFAKALKENSKAEKIIQVDLEFHKNISIFGYECAAEGIKSVFHEQSSLTCPMEQTDLLFIDTFHVFGQLQRELNRWHSVVNKYIVMHDTTVDEWYGEVRRYNGDARNHSLKTGIPESEILLGLWPAIEEFLEAHPEWTLHERFTNNNGLTILKRVDA